MKLNRTIKCQCGIYETKYTLVCHKGGTVSVKVPFVHWIGNSGSLDFDWCKVKDKKKANLVKKLFEADELIMELEGDFISLEDVLYGF